jgi:DNA-binding IclR family transcriptional regulator
MKQRASNEEHIVALIENNEHVPTQTIARAVDILTILGSGMHGVTAVSKKLGLSKATIHRLLKSLELTGLVMRDPENRQYCLGPLVIRLASDYLNAHQNLCIISRKDMQHLWNLSGETVSLLIQAGMEGMYIDEYESPQLLRYKPGKGTTTPLYVGSGGRVILSELADDKLKIILNNIKLEPLGPKTIIEKEALIKEVEKTRKQGYTISFEEKTAGGVGISVPIKNYICPVALSIIGPDARLVPKMMGLVEEMKVSAERISKKLLMVYRNNAVTRPRINNISN